MRSMFNLAFLVIGVALLSEIETGVDSVLVDSHKIIRRETTCDQRFLDGYNSSHSACLPPSPNVNASGVSEAEKTAIVDRHNQHRRNVTPEATDMLQMSWDDEIAKIAQGWASNCDFSHDAGGARADYERYGTIGQNLAWGSGSRNWTGVVDSWNKEKAYYDYTNNNSTDENEAVGHYTQVVWAKSFKIGCGFAQCGTTRFFVCNYGPAGNYRGVWPYTSGSSCAACPNQCNNKLCDCGGMDCYYDGKREFNIADCTCNCKHDLVAPNCTVDCASVNEPSYCTTWQYSCQWGYQYKCAFHCGLCPA